MTDNGYNIIKPIEGSQNIINLASIKHGEERKHRQPRRSGRSSPGRGQDKTGAEPDSPEGELRRSFNSDEEHGFAQGEQNESTGSENGKDKLTTDLIGKNENDQHSIDYCA